MNGSGFWIAKGELVSSLFPDGRGADAEADMLHRLGHVRVSTKAAGTEVKWSVFAPNWASLYLAMEWLTTAQGPIVLKYFLSGWFEETFADGAEARERMGQVLAKSDLRLSSRTFVLEVDPHHGSVVPSLRAAWEERTASPEQWVECVLDDDARRFRVERIGAQSTIARLWGIVPVSYPCVNGGSYDQIVARAYRDVLKTGKPRFDHVYAAMLKPDGEQTWIPYQRLILPHRVPSGWPAVAVMTEIAPVDIRIV